MNEIITFFRNFEQDQGMTCRLTVELPDSVYSLLIYSGSSCQKPELLSDQKFNDMESYQAYKLKVIESIGHSNGGLVVEVKDENEQLGIKIQGISAAETEAWLPPQHVFYLQPGYRLAEQPFDGKELYLQLHKDSHIILPVDEDAEKHFKSFRENYSTWFPADFEPIMLNLLRQPGLDLRVAHLEEKLEEKVSEKSVPVAVASNNVGISKRDSQPPPRKKLISTDTILPAVTALILAGILTAVGIYGYKNLINNDTKLLTEINTLKTSVESMKISKLPETTVVSVTPPPITGPVTEPPSNPPVEDLSSAINGLLAFLSTESQQHKIPNLSKLWDIHFGKIQNLNNLDKSELFKKKEFLWGMIKLPIVAAQDDTKFLENVDAITATKKVYEKVLDSGNDNIIKSDNQIRDMLAFLICQIQEIEDKPELKISIKKSFFNQSVTIFKAEPCTNLKIDNALPGIVKLKSELEKLSTIQSQPG